MEFKEWLAKMMESRGLNSASLAEAIEENQPTIYRILSGETKNPRLKIIRKLEDYFRDKFANVEADIYTQPHEVEATMGIAPDSIKIPLLNVTASMGYGSDVLVDELAIERIEVHKAWANRFLRPFSEVKYLAFIHAIGDSMSPTFSDGDILLVDTWDKSVTADKIYVIEAHDRLFIKRVRQRIDGSFEVSSDNPAVKTVDVLNGDSEINVKGRVIWVWNGKKI